jgi:multidrug efflux pump
MLGVTFFGLLLTPVFYVLLRKLAKKMERHPQTGGARSVVPHPVQAREE